MSGKYKTKQQSAIRECLKMHKDGYVTVGEIEKYLKDNNCQVGLTTIYRHLEKMQQSGNLLLSIINNVLDMARIESGRISLAEEDFSLPELVEIFDPAGINKSPAIFDIQKLNWMNGEYIRMMPLEKFCEQAMPYYKQTVKSDIDFMYLSSLLHNRTELLSDIPAQIDFIDELPEYDTSMFVHKKMKTTPENSLVSLKETLPVLESLNIWTEESIHEAVKKDGWEIFNRKGNTCYGIAASTTRIVRALMFNESVVLPISTYLDGQYGQDGVFTSVPAVLDATGVKEVVEIEMTKEEKEQFDASCSHLQSFYKEV